MLIPGKPRHQNLKNILCITNLSTKPAIKNTRKKSSLTNFLCLYDGLKLRSWNQEYVKWLLSEKQFELFKFEEIRRSNKPSIFVGKCNNLDILIKSTKKGWYVDISGSIHKWMNDGKHNHNDFYWKDFLVVYDEIVDTLCMEPSEMKIVNLELGVNCVLPDYVKFTIAQLLENVLSLAGKFDVKSHNYDKKSDRCKVDMCERYIKMYNKAIQNGIPYEILRFEIGFKKSRKIEKDVGVFYFNDLKKEAIREKGIKLLIKEFNTLLIYPPDFLERIPVALSEEDREIHQYPKREFWGSLKKRKGSEFKKTLSKFTRLVNQYCSYNIKDEVLEILADKLR